MNAHTKGPHVFLAPPGRHPGGNSLPIEAGNPEVRR